MKNKYDLLKVFAILLVVLGNVTNHYMEALPTKAITITIYLFHMTPIYLIRYWGCDAWPLWLSVSVTFVFALIVSIALTILFRASHLGILIGEK